MGKFNIKYIVIMMLYLCSVNSYAQNQETLQYQLWNTVLKGNNDKTQIDGWSLQKFLENEGWKQWEEWEETMNSNVVIDDVKNGYLEINLFYEQTKAAAYKDNSDNYTILKNRRYRFFNRSLSSNRNIEDVLPRNFGISNFISDSTLVKNVIYNSFYVEGNIPRNGTDTQLDIKVIPLGMRHKGSLLAFETFEHSENSDNMFLFGLINDVVKKLNNKESLTYFMNADYDAISVKDKTIIAQFIENDYQFENRDALRKFVLELFSIYKLNSAITYKSFILGWNRDTARFYIKDRIKNDNSIPSFVSFLENTEYFYAAQ